MPDREVYHHSVIVRKLGLKKIKAMSLQDVGDYGSPRIPFLYYRGIIMIARER